jgi:class 3 adenylate cyclase/CHASE2 domain-containing sensor protein
LLGALAAVTALFAGDGMGLLDGLAYDLSLTVTNRRPGSKDEPVAVIALDRDSLASDEIAPLPRVFLSPVWAKIVNGLTEANARAIGFDIIFAYSAGRFPGLEGQYDRDFLTALMRARGHVVLARSAGSYPAPPFVAAVFDPKVDAGKAEPSALGYAELAPDSDGVFRRVASQVETADGRPLLTLAASLISHAQGPAMPQQVLLAPWHPLEAMPTYRAVDVLRCLERDPAMIRQVFAGKVVLVGTTLPEEDRKRSPDRFMPPPVPPHVNGDQSGADQCRLDRLGASDPQSGTSPGMFIHAAAVEAIFTGNLIRSVPVAGRAAAAATMAVGGAALGFSLSPALGALAVAVLIVVCLAGAPLLLGFGLWFAPVLPVLAAIVSLGIAYVMRFVIEDRRRRRVQNAFGHYLAPAIVDQLTDSDTPLRLGGEERDVTVMFADLSGFTALSGKVGPTELMAVTNSYLGIIVAAVEATGGYIDKFIGDAVMGIWGAPAPEPDHAALAARAALKAVADVMRAKAQADAAGRPGYAVKIGLNSGRAVVGNVGAERRYNYTAVGETVNIAARLESVPGDYACRIVIGPATAAAIKDRFVLNELDWVKVKGKDQPLAVYELVAERNTASAEVLAYPEHYHVALEHYRTGAFAEAEKCWRQQLQHPYLIGASPPMVMAERAAALQADPPADWDGVYVKTTK